jgi:hypothetical protein
VNSIQIQIQFKSRSVFEFLFKIHWDPVEVVNIKVSPNGPIYLLEKIHIFMRLLSISFNLFLVSALMEKIKGKSELVSYFLSGRTHRPLPFNPHPFSGPCVSGHIPHPPPLFPNHRHRFLLPSVGIPALPSRQRPAVPTYARTPFGTSHPLPRLG